MGGSTTSIGFLIFPGMLQLDFTGAYGVLAAGPDAHIHLVWKDTNPVVSSDKLPFAPTISFEDCPPLDIIVVPGGGGVVQAMADEAVLHFLCKQAVQAKYVCSVCTGSLILGAAGLLRGYKATTHWLSADLLQHFGAIRQANRVVLDKNRVTAAGVTSGIDMALTLAGILWGDTVAQAIQLNMEYAPSPPYQAGSPTTAPRDLLEATKTKNAARQEERKKAVMAAAARLA